jgi:hypothetical protein
MAPFLSVYTPAILFIVLLTSLFGVWLYSRRVNDRLNQAIKLINDLYKLHQSQESKINSLLSDAEAHQSMDENETDATKPSLLNTLIEQASSKIKLELAEDVNAITQNSITTEIQAIKDISNRVLALENKTELLQQENPEFKRYTKANTLVKEGASVEEIMEASQLPRAEIEVLVGLQRHK